MSAGYTAAPTCHFPDVPLLIPSNIFSPQDAMAIESGGAACHCQGEVHDGGTGGAVYMPTSN